MKAFRVESLQSLHRVHFVNEDLTENFFLADTHRERFVAASKQYARRGWVVRVGRADRARRGGLLRRGRAGPCVRPRGQHPHGQLLRLPGGRRRLSLPDEDRRDRVHRGRRAPGRQVRRPAPLRGRPRSGAELERPAAQPPGRGAQAGRRSSTPASWPLPTPSSPGSSCPDGASTRSRPRPSASASPRATARPCSSTCARRGSRTTSWSSPDWSARAAGSTTASAAGCSGRSADASGDTIGFGARRIFDDDRIDAKYLNTPRLTDLQEVDRALRHRPGPARDRPCVPGRHRRGLHRRDGLSPLRRLHRRGHVRHRVRRRPRAGAAPLPARPRGVPRRGDLHLRR